MRAAFQAGMKELATPMNNANPAIRGYIGGNAQRLNATMKARRADGLDHEGRKHQSQRRRL